jgi:hypothetical protein
VTLGDAIKRVVGELGRLGVPSWNVILSTNLRTRMDGMPLANQAQPVDPGVAVYWKDGKHERVMAIDRYRRVADNLAALAATLDAMRAIERHGGAAILDRAFTGFTALPPPASSKQPWRDVLGHVHTLDAARQAYRNAAWAAHPDRGGTSEQMARVNVAWDEARKEFGI